MNSQDCNQLLRTAQMQSPESFYAQIDSLASHEEWTWSRNVKPSEINVTGKRANFHPNMAYGTVGCIVDKALNSNMVAYWEIRVEKIFGTSIMFGVGRDHTQLSLVTAFVDLLGQDSLSYGITHKGTAYHCGISFNLCSPLPEGQPCTIGMLFDGPKRQLSYFQDGIYIGTPFRQMDLTEPLYPMVTSTAQRSVFRLQNQKSMTHPVSLLQASLRTVHSTFGEQCDRLPIPRSLVNSLNKMEQSRKNRIQIIKRNSAIRKNHPFRMIARHENIFRVELTPQDIGEVIFNGKQPVIL